MLDYLKRRHEPLTPAVVDAQAIRQAIEALHTRRAELTLERERCQEYLQELGADEFLRAADAFAREDILTAQARQHGIADELALLDGTEAELNQKLVDAERAERLDSYQQRVQALWRQYQARLERRARLTQQVAALLDDLEFEATVQTSADHERMSLGRDARGLDVGHVELPPSLEPWLPGALRTLHERWQIGLEKGEQG
jgi:hypothetical protein